MIEIGFVNVPGELKSITKSAYVFIGKFITGSLVVEALINM
jgi:hypothetical protein